MMLLRPILQGNFCQCKNVNSVDCLRFLRGMDRRGRKVNFTGKSNMNNPMSSSQIPFEGAQRPASMTMLWKPMGFTLLFGGAAFGGCAIWQYEKMRNTANSIIRRSFFGASRRSHPLGWRRNIHSWWRSLTDGQRVFIPICALNVLVFLAWRVPRLQTTMVKYFCSNPAAKNNCWPMLLSTFSHYSAFHLFANMYVLHSFSSGAVSVMGTEQFLGFYLTAGVAASLTSYILKTITKQKGLSLGASGAIMAVLSFVCFQYPDTELCIMFLPFIKFDAGTALKMIMSIDTAGVLLGWRFFDHAAHLGGALYGIFWAYIGNELIWQNREPLLQMWHKVRGGIK